METSKDMEQLHALNGYAASRLPGKHETTPIKLSKIVSGMSSNRLVREISDTRQESGTGRNRFDKCEEISTSARVLSRSNDLPPRKKVKTEHAHPRTTSAPETIDVDDYFVILDGNGHTNPDFGNSSPDELNIRSQSIEGAFPSEEAFHTPGLSSIVWNNNPPIAPDGENIEWAKKDSQVKEKVAKIEAKTRMEDEPNGIDLRTTLKTKDKMKIKVKSEKFSTQQVPQEQSRRSPAGENVLPLKELLLDNKHYDSEKLMIYWLPCDSLLIESEGSHIFGPFFTRRYTDTLVYHGPDSPDFPIDHDPVFQLKIRSSEAMFGSKVKCLTAKLDCSSAGAEESYYTDLLVWLKNRVNANRAYSQDELREVIAWTKSEPVASPSKSTIRFTPRRSTQNISAPARSPALDKDEIILSYPSDVPGSVKITNGDYLRLQPGGYLNDNLIEFGLKLWLKELEQSDAILASQIHVFNSFFYEKLSIHHEGGPDYKSVQKWTSKFDIFQKKYIIVPINENFHWYFAIICDPGYVLVPTASNVTPPSTQQQTRQSISEAMTIDKPDEAPTASKPISASISENDRDKEKFLRETEVEDTLHDFKSSCTIGNFEPNKDLLGTNGGGSVSSYVTDDGVLSANLQTARLGQQRDKGKRKSNSEFEPFFMNNEDDGDKEGSALSDTSKTYIFTFDSLGRRHQKVIRNLSAYLKLEALDKKKIVTSRNVGSKLVQVPSQPNSWDCGIYLLHLAQTFMSNPVHYRSMILLQHINYQSQDISYQWQKEIVSPADRKAAWKDDQVSGRREDFRARIMNLSHKWKKERAAKEEAKHQETSSGHTLEVVESDCDVDIIFDSEVGANQRLLQVKQSHSRKSYV